MRDPVLTAKSISFAEDTDTNQFFLSDVSAWEGSIKYGQQKLHLPEPPKQFFPDRVRRAGYYHLPIDLTHVTNVYTLPPIHGDPFDRLLISQAMLEEMVILSEDRIFQKYEVNRLRLRDI